jgi:hypothetical protein
MSITPPFLSLNKVTTAQIGVPAHNTGTMRTWTIFTLPVNCNSFQCSFDVSPDGQNWNRIAILTDTTQVAAVSSQTGNGSAGKIVAPFARANLLELSVNAGGHFSAYLAAEQ